MRVERLVEKPDARRLKLSDGRLCVDFSSNSYLGLQDEVGIRAARLFLKKKFPSSAGSSRMVSGTHILHRRLESELAGWLGAEDAAVFGSGYLCCFGVISALTGSRDRILFDEKIHASLRTGIHHSESASESFKHADVSDLKRKLAAGRPRGGTFIVTDGLFSMDGDFAPLAAMDKLAERHNAWLIVDDAHAIGGVGRQGKGTFEISGLKLARRHILIGTLSKTFASYGGFVASEKSVVGFVKARSKEFIYTTAAPPFQMLAAMEALSIVRSKKGAALRRTLDRNIRLLGQLLGRNLSSPIVRVPVSGGPEAVVAAGRKLWDEGCYAVGMRYPTVPRGQEMIRISISAAHMPGDIRHLADVLMRLTRR